jgi:hypothetical protein
MIAGLVAALAVWKLPDSRGYIAAVLWGLCGILISNSFALTLTNVITLIATLLLVGEFLIAFRRRRSINIYFDKRYCDQSFLHRALRLTAWNAVDSLPFVRHFLHDDIFPEYLAGDNIVEHWQLMSIFLRALFILKCYH